MKKILVCLVCLGLVGCASFKDKYLKEHPDTSSHIINCMLNHDAWYGMNEEQVEIALGKPMQIYQDKVDNKTTWVCKSYYCPTWDCYLYIAFDDGKVIRIESKSEKKEREIENYFKEHTERSQFKKAVLGKKIAIGMNKDEVIFSLDEPQDINRTVGSLGVHEQWVYSNAYLYFEDGILTNWQD